MEIDPKNNQVLDCIVYRKLQRESGGLPQPGGNTHQEPIFDPEWLKDSLYATLDNKFGSPVRQESSKMTTSPVSTLDICWSPKAAASGPPLKNLKTT